MDIAKIRQIRFFGLVAALLILTATASLSQEPGSLRLLEFRYGFHFPFGDMKDRFGSSSDIGITLLTTGWEKKMMVGLEASYIFGNVVREDVLEGLRAEDGAIIGLNGTLADVYLKERGFYLGVTAGKIFPTTSHERNLTGIRAQIGAGLLQHKIRVQDNFNNVVALNKPYLKGYDRLTNGPAFHLALGYQYQNPTNNLHFHIMGDLYGARTASRRDFDFATGGDLDQKRMDILAGLTLAYIVTISRTERPEHIYY